MVVLDRAINGTHKGTGRIAQTGDLRTRLQGQSAPGDQPAVEPGECGAFTPRSSPTSSADLGMNFAAGVLSLTGSWSREALAFVLARSAPRHEVVAADFAYTVEQSARCSAFRRTTADAPPAAVRLMPVPALGEKAYAVHSSPPEGGTPAAGGTVSLQVLQGTVSFGLSRQVPATASDGELTSALEPLVRLAEKLVHEVPAGQPHASAPPAAEKAPPAPQTAPAPQTTRTPLHQTPEQLAALLQGITGPDGNPARVLEGRYAPAPPASPPPPETSACVYDDAAYLASLPGAATVVAEFPGAAPDRSPTSLRLVGLSPPSGPARFDRRATELGECSSIREQLPGGGARPWSALLHPAVDTSGDTGYAVVYTLADGSGLRHVLVGARKGTLSVEAETRTLSDDAVQQAADGLAASINKVMAKVGS